MIELLLSTAFAQPRLAIESQTYAYSTPEFEQRTLATFKWKETPWNIELHALHVLTFDQHTLNLQGWILRYNHNMGKAKLRIGNQIIRWGQLDLLSDLDTLNGMDLTMGPTIKPEWRRIPTPAIQLILPLGDWETTLQWLPLSARDNISWMGSPWSILSSNSVNSLLDDAQDWPGDLLTEAWLHDALSSVQDNLQAQNIFPVSSPQELDYGDIGFSIGREGIALSSHLYAGWMRSRRPLARLHPNVVSYLEEERLPTSLELDQLNEIIEEPISTTYPRQLLIGGDLSTTVSVFGLRTELCYLNQKVRPIQYMQATMRPYLSAAFALDYNFDMNMIALEARAHHFFDSISQPWLEANETVQIAVVGQFALPYAWDLQLSGQYDIMLHDLFVQTQIFHRISSQWALALQAMMLHGPDGDNPFTYPSGISGMWREYDHLSLRIHWNP
jgi:hypothetical protein